MSDFTSKLSLYDILTMIIPGGMTLLFLQGVLSDSTVRSVNQSIQFLFSSDGWIVGLVMSYLVGFGIHLLSNVVWSGFRNNPIRIKAQLEQVKSEIGGSLYLDRLYSGNALSQSEVRNNSSDYVKSAYWPFTSIWIVFGCLSMYFNRFVTNDITNAYLYVINVCFIIVFFLITVGRICFRVNTQDAMITNAYYKAYYYVMQKSKYSNIATLECQVAFLQSVFIPLSLLLCLPCDAIYKIDSISHSICAFYIKDLLLLICCCVYPVVVNRIDKIHYLVWCDYAYIKGIER